MPSPTLRFPQAGTAAMPGDRCPGALHAVAAQDGMLARIRVPGGLLRPAQLATIAELAQRYGDGRIDITARANVQIRGLAPASSHLLAEELARAGLFPCAKHDRVRNITASPFAGIEADELIDTRPLVRELDARLVADAALAALPAKFTFALDGGCRPFESRGIDIALCAVTTSDGISFHLALGGRDTGAGVVPALAVEAMLIGARAALAYGRLGRLPGADAAIRSALVPYLRACPTPPRQTSVAHVPLGVLPAHHRNLVNVVPCVPFGRLQARQVRGIADLSQRYDADLRLAPWRGVVVGAVPRGSLTKISNDLAALDLACDSSRGYTGIAACVGIGACTAALADVRGDAQALARRLAQTPTTSQVSINLAACSKRCAMGAATVELIGASGGYDVFINQTQVASAVSAHTAIEAALTKCRP